MNRAPSTPEVLTLRKQLTGLFSDYDAVAKRIRALPVPASGSGQERVQQAVWGRAVNFMQMHIGLLQVHLLNRFICPREDDLNRH